MRTTEYYGIEWLRNLLNAKSTRVKLRYEYYDMKNSFFSSNTIIPSDFKTLANVLGWCAKAVDTLTGRLVFDGFTDDDFYIGEIFELNNSDILYRSAINDALIGSCSFVYISEGEDGFPRLQVIDGGSATGIIDPTTSLLREGYAVLERDIQPLGLGKPTVEAYFTAGRTQIIRNGKPAETYTSKAPYALLVPMVFKPNARRPLGHSRISRACMSLMRQAARTLWRSEVSAEFYSFPQKYILGTSSELELDNRAATISSFLRIDKDEDGDRPTIGQFQQQSMLPYTEQVKMFASAFAGEADLTLDDLGFSTANPSTAEAWEASHENLANTVRDAQKTFGSCFKNVGYLAACLRDKQAYSRKMMSRLTPEWLPPPLSPSRLSALGDAVGKLQQAFPDYFDERKLHRLTGM